MTLKGYNSGPHHRRTIRLQGYDYTSPGAYFVTICVQDRLRLFGEVVDDTMCLSYAGRMVQAVWDELPSVYPRVAVDEFVVMPNHVHGIIEMVGCDPDSGQVAPGQGIRAGTAPAPTDGPVGAAPRGRPVPTVPADRYSRSNHPLAAGRRVT